MDLLEATETSIVRKVDGVNCTFHIVSAYDRAALLRADLEQRKAEWKADREQLVADLDDAEIKGAQRFNELQLLADRKPVSASEANWIEFVNDPMQEVAIFTASLRPTHGDKAEELARKARLSLADKAKICMLSVVTQGPEAPTMPESGADPNASIPPAYGTTGTTSTGSTPAAS